MTTEEYLFRITNYIFDKRNTRALLIDGDWGTGKTYFIKNCLIPEIIKKNENEEKYIPILVSLFGLSTIDSLQKQIYSAFVEAVMEDKKFDKVRNAVNKISVFGPIALKGIGNIFNVGDDLDKMSDQIGNSVLQTKNDKIILIFDDFERSQIDIIELMGFCNNLCENNGYRLIIVSNENEVSRNENAIAQAIYNQTKVIDNYLNNDNVVADSESIESNSGVSDDKFHRQDISIIDDSFNSIMYQKTHQKLFGLTIKYYPDLEAAYDNLTEKYVSEKYIKYIQDHKNIIINSGELLNHKNLRTLISVFICIESIFIHFNTQISSDTKELCNQNSVDYKKIIEEEKTRIIKYIVKSACERAYGTSNNLMYDDIELGNNNSDDILRYSFVDEYWNSLCANHDVIKSDFSKRIKQLIMSEIDKKTNSKHYELSLYKLRDWFMLEQSCVDDILNNLKDELKNKEYKSNEFKKIIQILLDINNPRFGMYTGFFNDDLSNFEINNETQKMYMYNYAIRNVVDIKSYVDLMLKYFDDDKFIMYSDELKYFSQRSNSNKNEEEYLLYIQPLLDKIDSKMINSLLYSNNGKSIFEDQNIDLYNFIVSNRDSYLSQKRFFSLYGFKRFDNILCNENGSKIYELINAIEKIYNFSNLNEFFISDDNVIDGLYKSLMNDRVNCRIKYNPDKDRTKEMALRHFEYRLYGYLHRLREN